jgi:hypothetical protein
MAKRLVTVDDLLAGQVGLDLECADRVYLNGYVPNLQVPGPSSTSKTAGPCASRPS